MTIIKAQKSTKKYHEELRLKANVITVLSNYKFFSCENVERL